MTGLPIQLQAALIAAMAGLGAAIFAFISSIISARVQRRNAELQARTAAAIKLAEFRQIWIEKLRENFVSLQVKIASRPLDVDKELSDDIFRILLMMNKKDVSVDAIKDLVSRSLAASEDGRRAQVELLGLLQDVVKREWEVVKADLRNSR
ncbi:hypothetical protein [Tsuneonella rigui]|uniref:hypothetical protein n=1 Tax=Tsuneonella rigui TaxID=1708790 RepID=UPI0013DF6905|nr:hypothetical protein [Tsuneonella rigui]